MLVVFLGVALLSTKMGMGIVLNDLDPLYSNGTVNWQCLESKHETENLLEVGESVFNCAKKNLYLDLVNKMNSDCVDIGDGVTFTRQSDAEPAPRDRYSIEEEPATLRGLMQAYSRFLSQRNVRWDLGYIYPGLVLRIGPTLNGAGVLEFGLERRLDYNERAKLGPGQMIVRRAILPHLLGFRMNLSSLLPLLLGIIILITKNAFVFSKVTLVLSVLLTLKSLFLLQAFRMTQHHTTIHQGHPIMHDPVDFGDTITVSQGVGSGTRPRPQGYSISEPSTDSLLFQMVNALPPFRGVNDKATPKKSNTGKRNFSWE